MFRWVFSNISYSYRAERHHIWLQCSKRVRTGSRSELLLYGSSFHPLQTQRLAARSLEHSAVYTTWTRYAQIIPFKYNICQTPLPNSDPHYPSRDECWSISRWTIHPAHSPDHHRHCDHPLLQMLPTKKQNPTNVSVLYSRLVYDCVSVYVHAYVCTGVYVCVCRGRGGVWCLSNTGSWSFFSCPVWKTLF